MRDMTAHGWATRRVVGGPPAQRGGKMLTIRAKQDHISEEAMNDHNSTKVAPWILALLQEAQDDRKRAKSSDKVISWLNFAVTLCSTIVLASLLGWLSHRVDGQRLALESQKLALDKEEAVVQRKIEADTLALESHNSETQDSSAALNEIHDLTSDDDLARNSAEIYLAERGKYGIQVVDAANKFGDVDTLDLLSKDPAIQDIKLKAQFSSTRQDLLSEMESDQRCLNGKWQEVIDSKMYWDFRVVAPKLLHLSRNDSGSFTFRKTDAESWSGRVFIPPSGGYDIVYSKHNGECSQIDSSRGWKMVRPKP